MKTKLNPLEFVKKVSNLPEMMHDQSHLKKVYAFWKADDRNVGCEVHYNDIDESFVISLGEWMLNYLADWEASDEKEKNEIIELYKDQLSGWREFTEAPIIIFLNIWFLEYIGVLHTDNFNGITYMWEKTTTLPQAI